MGRGGCQQGEAARRAPPTRARQRSSSKKIKARTAALEGEMSTTIKDLKDEEEDDLKQGEEDEEEGEESEDEDYCPNPASEDEDEDSDEGVYDDDIPEVGGGGGAKKPAAAGKKRGAAKAGAKEKKGKGARPAKRQKGGIALEEDDDAEPSFDAEPPAAAEEEPTAEEPAVEKKTSSVDDLWASMKEESAPKKPPAKSSVDDLWAELNGGSSGGKSSVSAAASSKTTDGGGVGAAKPAGAASGGLDIKALLAKTGAKAGASSSAATGKMVEIKQRMDFCGEEIIVTKKVREGSAEELAYRQQGISKVSGAAAGDAPKAKMADLGESTLGAGLGSGGSKNELVSGALAAASQLRKTMLKNPAMGAPSSFAAVPGGLRTDSSLEFKGGLSALPSGPTGLAGLAAAKPTGLQGLLANLDGKKKMSTMEKSKFDWGNAKSKMDDQTRDDMERFAKDGYIAKQAFLARTDERQAEVARSNRRKGMGLKD